MTLICKFCQKETTYVPLRVADRRTFEVHYCFSCNAEYVDYGSDDGKATHLYTEIDKKMYRWSVTEHKAKLSGYVWYVGEPGVPGVVPNKRLRLLKSFETPPTIVPNNVEQKIRFILLFL
jgi:hypothetical protein